MQNTLVENIKLAFNGVKLGDGISLNMTEYYDSGGAETEYLELSKFDEREDWSKIDDKTLEKFSVTFSFTDLNGFKFYTPAYMTYAIKNFDTSESIITDFTIYAMDTDHYLLRDIGIKGVFNSNQLLCIIGFLMFVIDNPAHFDSKIASENLLKIRQAM